MIYTIFKDKVAKYPDSLAFVLEDGRNITYAQADHIIDNISAKLFTQGIKQGDRIGAMFEFESLHPFVFYALDKLNASYVPFDVNTPKNQLEVDVEKLKLDFFILPDNPLVEYRPVRFKGGCLTFGEQDLAIDPITQLREKVATTAPRDESIPVYIVSSSGTSCNKKWMGLEGAGLRYWEQTEEKQLELKHGHKELCTRSPAYDARISEYLRALIAGGTLHLISRHQRKDMDFVITYCKRNGISELLLIASQLNGDDLENKISKLTSLKNLIVTGDACSPRLQKLCIQYQINLFNAYGPTEALFGISILRVNNLSLINEKGHPVVPIGFPIGEEIKVHIVEGRLYIESPYLIKGYIDDPDKTALFFPEIIINGKPTRVFDTGDCFETRDNLLVFKGRHEASHDSKIIGVKVDSHGIEQLILQYPGISQACVVSKTVSDRTKLVAYLVLKSKFDSLKFVEYLQGWLKAEEMPILIKIDTLPIMAVSDKIDRKALQERTDHPSEKLSIISDNAVNKYNNEIIEKLENIWESLFNIKPSSHDHNFTFQGGDSLYAMRLLKKIQTEIDPDFSHSDLFTLEPITINTIYEKIVDKRSEESEPIALISPLTYPHRPGKPIFWMPPPLLGEGNYSLGKLAKSFAETHDANIIGLSDPGIYDKSKVPKTLDEAVSRYVKAILKAQPQGPYNLIGFSYGCMLGYHIALALESMGHMVHELHLVDGFSPIFYQRMTQTQHATLLKELSAFITEMLSNTFFNASIADKKIPALDHLEKTQQIETLIDHLIRQVNTGMARGMLNIVRAHLRFLLVENPPIKINICVARLYLSKPEQSIISLIDEIPGLSKSDPDHDFYYWNNYFTSITKCRDFADCDHLALINEIDSSKLFFQYSNLQARCVGHALSKIIIPKPALLSRNISGDYSLTIFDTYYEQKTYLIEKGICTSIESLELGAEIYNTQEPSDLCYEDRFALVARFPKEHLPEIHAFLKSFGLAHYSPTQQASIHDAAENLLKIPCSASDLHIRFSFRGQPIRSFFYRSAPMSRSLLTDLKINEPGLSITLDQEEENFTFFYNFTGPNNIETAERIQKMIFDVTVKILPYSLHGIRPSLQPTPDSRVIKS
jgi:thioesterase domain-containing protein/acyl-coenzyme A synthetase/AMP-(fatty) acid ligase